MAAVCRCAFLALSVCFNRLALARMTQGCIDDKFIRFGLTGPIPILAGLFSRNIHVIFGFMGHRLQRVIYGSAARDSA